MMDADEIDRAAFRVLQAAEIWELKGYPEIDARAYALDAELMKLTYSQAMDREAIRKAVAEAQR